jgi:hypothetical protein
MLDATGTALIVIRVWCEEGSDRPFRGEMRTAADVASGLSSPQTFLYPDDLIEVVRGFVEDVACPPTLVTAASHLGHN